MRDLEGSNLRSCPVSRVTINRGGLQKYHPNGGHETRWKLHRVSVDDPPAGQDENIHGAECLAL